MLLRRTILALPAAALLSLSACSRSPQATDATDAVDAAPTLPPDVAWLLAQPDDARQATVARHLRGLDVAMVEIGYRYAELHWAGEDANWSFASYQATKIRLALDHAVERRPKRGESARMLHQPLDSVAAAAARSDQPAFRQSMAALTASCNACHVAEQVAFMRVIPPQLRLSVIRGTTMERTP
jgi:cytochrome c556